MDTDVELLYIKLYLIPEIHYNRVHVRNKLKVRNEASINLYTVFPVPSVVGNKLRNRNESFFFSEPTCFCDSKLFPVDAIRYNVKGCKMSVFNSLGTRNDRE